MTTSLAQLRAEASKCRACPLWEHATQTVFGEGPAHTPLVLMGETPGDQEDKQGHPFVGPAGRVLDDALAEAGIAREGVYLTNAVKHFKWTPARGGKLRLHKKPTRAEVVACRPWWEREIAAIKPQVFGLLGATAAQAVLGPTFRVTKQRGEWFELDSGIHALATIHPSAVLRAEDRRNEEFAGLVKDLRTMTERLDGFTRTSA